MGYQCWSLCSPCKCENQLLIKKNDMKSLSLEGRIKVDLKKKRKVFYILGQAPVKLFFSLCLKFALELWFSSLGY